MTQQLDAAKARKFVENVFCAGYHHDPDKMIQESEWLPFVAELLTLACPPVPDAVREAAKNLRYEEPCLEGCECNLCTVVSFILSGEDVWEQREQELLAKAYDACAMADRNAREQVRLGYGEESTGEESPCQEGGNYGLCKTHPTCDLVRRRIAALGIAAESAKEK